MSSTVATQSRMASLTASLSVRLPLSHGLDLGAEQAHPEHVELLALDVDRAHVHLALESEQGGGGGRGHAVLTGAGLGDQPRLAHPLGQQRLAEDVVDLVRAGVVEVLALEQQADAELPAEVVALGEDRRPAGVVAQHGVELGAEHRVGPRLAERRLQLLARRHQRLRDVAAAELAEAAARRGSPITRGSGRRNIIRRSSRRASRRRRGTARARRRGPARRSA